MDWQQKAQEANLQAALLRSISLSRHPSIQCRVGAQPHSAPHFVALQDQARSADMRLLQNFKLQQDQQMNKNYLHFLSRLQQGEEQHHQDLHTGTVAPRPKFTRQDSSTETAHREHIIPEFLYTLVSILEDESTNDIIEWNDGRIIIHKPKRLEPEILDGYFRRANLASFQRQLNYFGFHKETGYGKHCPCTYVNKTVIRDIKSILTLKRSTRNPHKKRSLSAKAQQSKESYAEKAKTSFNAAARTQETILQEKHKKDFLNASVSATVEPQARHRRQVSIDSEAGRRTPALHVVTQDQYEKDVLNAALAITAETQARHHHQALLAGIRNSPSPAAVSQEKHEKDILNAAVSVAMVAQARDGYQAPVDGVADMRSAPLHAAARPLQAPRRRQTLVAPSASLHPVLRQEQAHSLNHLKERSFRNSLRGPSYRPVMEHTDDVAQRGAAFTALEAMRMWG